MDKQARLTAALAAGGAPSRDPAFTMAVMRAAEGQRHRSATARAMLKGAGMAAAAASLAVPFLGWAGSNGDALSEGIVGAASLLLLVAVARVLSARATAILRH